MPTVSCVIVYRCYCRRSCRSDICSWAGWIINLQMAEESWGRICAGSAEGFRWRLLQTQQVGIFCCFVDPIFKNHFFLFSVQWKILSVYYGGGGGCCMGNDSYRTKWKHLCWFSLITYLYLWFKKWELFLFNNYSADYLLQSLLCLTYACLDILSD